MRRRAVLLLVLAVGVLVAPPIAAAAVSDGDSPNGWTGDRDGDSVPTDAVGFGADPPLASELVLAPEERRPGPGSAMEPLVAVTPRSTAARTPEIAGTSPSEDVVRVTAGNRVEFAVDATGPEGSSVSIYWFVNGTHRGSGPTFSHVFERSGTYPVVAVVTDGTGTQTDRAWLVEVRRFDDPPELEVLGGQLAVEPGERHELRLVGVHHPAANDRPLRVELAFEPPPGVTLLSPALERTDAGHVVTTEVGPGESVDVGVDVTVDRSLAGETLAVDYRVTYAPAAVPTDSVELRARTVELVVADEEEDDNEGSPWPVDGDLVVLAVTSLALSFVLTLRSRRR